MRPWNWKSHVGIAFAIAATIVTLLITTEGCSQPATITCPNGTKVEVREHDEKGWRPNAEEVREICEAGEGR